MIESPAGDTHISRLRPQNKWTANVVRKFELCSKTLVQTMSLDPFFFLILKRIIKSSLKLARIKLSINEIFVLL